MVVLVILSIFAILVFAIYILSRWKFDYWKDRNVPHLNPTLFLGNYGDFILQRKSIGEVVQKICRRFPQAAYIGAFYGTEPVLIVQDLELVKLVTTKDFYHFNGREVSKYVTKELTTQSLFYNHGDVWKILRHNMTPLFTPVKMKNMFHIIKKQSLDFETMLDEETKMSSIVGVNSLMARYTMDCISSCAFGVDTNSQRNDGFENPFRMIGDMIFEVSKLRSFGHTARSIWPFLFYKLGFKAYPKLMVDFFHNLLAGVFKERDNRPSNRSDFVDLMLNLKLNDYISGDAWGGRKIKLKVDDDLIVSQCILIFAAGYETSANALSFTLYHLAQNAEAQRRAFEEVDLYMEKHKGELEYECVNELPYVEACLDEAMRLYPALGVLTREVVEDCTLPTGLQLQKGLRIHLPVYHLQRDPEHFPNPEEYRPERFLPEEKQNIKSYSYMPFGEGPRICIGYRFAKMQMLAGLITVLKKFKLELAEDMPQTLILEPGALVSQAQGGIRVKMTPRQGWEQRVFAR